MARGLGDQVDTKFTRGAPYKTWEGKNVQNSAQFLTTFDFDRESLRNASTVKNLNSTWSTTFHPLLDEKKFGELWSTNQKVIDAHVDPPKWIFSEY